MRVGLFNADKFSSIHVHMNIFYFPSEGLKKDGQAEGGKLGIYDGSEVLFTTSDWSLVTLAKLFWRYGMDIYNIKSWIQEKVMGRMKRYMFITCTFSTRVAPSTCTGMHLVHNKNLRFCLTHL